VAYQTLSVFSVESDEMHGAQRTMTMPSPVVILLIGAAGRCRPFAVAGALVPAVGGAVWFHSLR